MDTHRLKYILSKIDPKENLNLLNFTDPSMCFAASRQILKNLPKSFLELVLNTNSIEIAEIIFNSDFNIDVNFLHSETGNPLYYAGFSSLYKKVKKKILIDADLLKKTYKGQNVLFFLVKLYSKTNESSLLNDFSIILSEYPMLITDRDQYNLTLIETILTMKPSRYCKAIDFLFEISKFIIINLLSSDNSQLFKDMVYNSYGLILLNSPIFIDSSMNPIINRDKYDMRKCQSVTVERFIKDSTKLPKLNHSLVYFFESKFMETINDLIYAIKTGDINLIYKIMNDQNNKNLLRIKDGSGRSCLHLATFYGKIAVIKYFNCFFFVKKVFKLEIVN
jgi:hypothetical protein